MSGFLSRAVVNSVLHRKNDVGGIEVNSPPFFFFFSVLSSVYIFSGLLSISTAMNTLLLCLRHI